jgi:DNA-binding NarL/FixJ family response regulator
MAGGVSGFVLRDAPVEARAAAIRRRAAGEDIVDVPWQRRPSALVHARSR